MLEREGRNIVLEAGAGSQDFADRIGKFQGHRLAGTKATRV